MQPIQNANDAPDWWQVTFHAPVSGIYVASTTLVVDTTHNFSLTVHNMDTGELAIVAEFSQSLAPYAGYGFEHVVLDRAATTLVLSPLTSLPKHIHIWSVIEQKFLCSVPVKQPTMLLLSDDGSQLFHDNHVDGQKTLHMRDTATGIELWSAVMECNGTYFGEYDFVAACCTCSKQHIAIMFLDKLETPAGRLDRTTLQFRDVRSGALTQTAVVVPFFAVDCMQSAVGEYALMVGGSQNSRVAIVLVGSDLITTRIVSTGLAETDIFHFVRFGPSNTVIVDRDHESTVSVLSYDSCLAEDYTEDKHGISGGIRKLCDPALPQRFDENDKFCSHAPSMRFAIGLGSCHRDCKKVYVYALSTGTLQTVYDTGLESLVLQVGAVDECVVLL
jgi:hypothetical protein